MTVITNLRELEEKLYLEEGDIVKFIVKEQIIEYRVLRRFLNHLDTYCKHNNKIFEILEIDEYKLATKAYKYKTDTGYWPYSKHKDFPALTRLVKELYLIIEKREIKYTKFTRFEIMDI